MLFAVHLVELAAEALNVPESSPRNPYAAELSGDNLVHFLSGFRPSLQILPRPLNVTPGVGDLQ